MIRSCFVVVVVVCNHVLRQGTMFFVLCVKKRLFIGIADIASANGDKFDVFTLKSTDYTKGSLWKIIFL